MTTSWELHPGQNSYYESASGASRIAPRCRDAVPIGTVASRIIELQKLAFSSKSDGSRSPVTTRREKSRTGFGRRAKPRFGQPTSRSSKPHEEGHMDPKHSFLGLKTRRGNHLEEHALVDGRTEQDQIAGLSRQVPPSELGAKAQFEATRPLSILHKVQSRRNSQAGYSSQKMDSFVSSNTENQLSSIALPMSPLPGASCHGGGGTGLTQERFNDPATRNSRQRRLSDQQKSSCERLSVETTSTMRRQSIKDLYYRYGIQRPAGLIPSENIAFDIIHTSPRPLIKYRYCHECSWPALIDVVRCKCGHSYCEGCERLSHDVIPSSNSSDEYIESMLEGEGRSLQEAKVRDRYLVNEIPKETPLEYRKGNPKPEPNSPQEGFHSQQTSTRHRSHSREELCNVSVKFPVLHIEETMPHYGFGQIGPIPSEVSESSSVFKQTTIASETLTSIQGSPFPLTSSFLSTCAPSTLPVGTQAIQLKSQDFFHHNRHQQPKGRCHRSSHSSSSHDLERGGDSDSCDSSGCQATHQGYRPYRHSITCIKKRRRYPEDTDSGYVAGASHLDDLEGSLQKADPGSKAENLLCGRNRCGKHHLSPHPKKSEDQLSLQNSSEDEESPFQNSFGRQEGVQYNRKQAYSKDCERSSFNFGNVSLLDTVKPSGRSGKENGHVRNQNGSDANGSQECQLCLEKDPNQVCRAGYRRNQSNVHTKGPSQIAKGNTTANAASLFSIPKSLQPPPKILSKIEPSGLAEQPINTKVVPKPHMENNSPDRLTNDTVVLTGNAYNQDMLTARKEKQRMHIRMNSGGKSKLEDPMKTALHSSQEANQSSFDTICNATEPQAFCATVIASPSSPAQKSRPGTRAHSYMNPPIDMTASVHTPQSGDLLSHKSPPASRRLSAFFKLQEQNSISSLTKRLQEHQDELKGIGRLSDDGLGAVQKASFFQARGSQMDQPEAKLEREFTERKLERTNGDSLPSSSHLLRERVGEAKQIGTDWQRRVQDSLFHSTPQDMREEAEKEHDCACKRRILVDTNGVFERHTLSGADACIKSGSKSASENSINGLTILIHLEGREDVVIKAVMSRES